MHDDTDNIDSSFTDSIRICCENCGEYSETPIVIHTDGHWAEIEVLNE